MTEKCLKIIWFLCNFIRNVREPQGTKLKFLEKLREIIAASIEVHEKLIERVIEECGLNQNVPELHQDWEINHNVLELNQNVLELDQNVLIVT